MDRRYVVRSLVEYNKAEMYFRQDTDDYLSSIINKGEKLDICRCPILSKGTAEYIYKNLLGTLVLKSNLYEGALSFVSTDDLKTIMEYVITLFYPRNNVTEMK